MLLAIATAAQAQTAFGGGSGTEPDPYLIYTTDHLDQLAADVNNGNMYENTYFKLMVNLSYTGKTYTPIGCVFFDGTQVVERRFCGVFWGNNHSINNVIINSQDDHCGLFGFVGYGGEISNLTLGGNSSIVSKGNAGGIAGEVWSNAKIMNCHVGENVLISVHPVASGSAYAPGDLGGIAGCSSGRIAYCVSKASINYGGIAKTKNLGGVVGGLYSEGRVDYCRFLGTVEGTLHVGDVVGSSSGTLNYNYYHTSVRHGGVDGNDTNGAKWMGTVTFGEQVSGSLPEATFEDGGTPYFVVGKAMVMSNMNYDAPAGYVVASVTYSANGVALVEDGANHRFTMPDEDVTITGSATLKRDIGYSDWVTIEIPSQAYTGDPLTPVVTVTDNMTGAPVTLTEGVHYTVTLPDGLTDYGHYDITITGIGTFTGQTTATFTITPPQGTEENPIVIHSTEEMDAFAAAVNSGLMPDGQYFLLDADLDYTNKTYTPVGTESNRFKGTFDGHGHSISNVVINEPDHYYQALFGVIGDNGTVKNLVLGAGSSITGTRYVGGIAGICYGTITECSVSEGVSISGNYWVGGIAGRIVGTLSGCVNRASVSGEIYVGGIAGISYNNPNNPVTNNFNLGAVSGNYYNGGIVGASNNNDALSNNYYVGACNVGGINGSDVEGRAMRGWVVSASEGIFVQQMPDDDFNFTGLTYDGIIYLGAGQTGYFVVGRIDGSAGNFAASAGTLTPVSSEVFTENYYALAMPTQGQDVVVSSTDISLAVPGYGESTNAGWRFIASPVAGSIEAEAVGNIFFPNHDLYRFNQSATLEWENYKQEGGHYHFAIENGRGYLYASETDITLFFSGPYNQGTEPVEVPLVYDANASFAGWNLVGNPFPVAAYANRSYYTMNADGTGIEPNAVSSATAIPACTGVMVKAETTGEKVTFSRTAQQSAGNNGTIQIAVAQADTRGNAIQDKAIVSFNAGDRLEKFVFGETDAKIYIPQGGKDYAVATVGRDAPWHVSTTDEIPVNFKAAKNGTYPLTFDTQNLDLEYLHLIDNLTGADIDLIPLLRGQGGLNDTRPSTASYTFTAKTTDYASRFRLVFSGPADGPSADEQPFAYHADGEIHIVADTFDVSLQVVDVMGRVVVSTDVARNVSTNGMTPGVYVLRLINGENVRTQKIVID